MASLPQGRKHRFNVFDFILIILIIALVTVTAVKFIRANPGVISGGDKTAICVITAENLPEALKEQIQVGDSLYDTESSQLLGNVTEVKYEVYKLKGINELTGNAVTTDVEGKITLTVTIETRVWLDNGTYNVDGYRLSVGRTMSVRTDRLAVSGECSSLTLKDES